MKKVLLVLVALIGISFAANAQQDRASVPGDSGNTVLVSVSADSQTSSTITFYNNSTKSVEVCVSVYNAQGSEVGKGCYSVPGATSQGYHSETTETLSKTAACRTCSSGCEAKRIKITSVK
ncbi:MAG: hypothetical protein IJ622_00930 [Bacteroidales bacterium]|nr:hypothetical protein [Bacteroidales bacterium]